MSLKHAAVLMALAVAAMTAQAHATVVYQAGPTVGNQEFGGALGLDFAPPILAWPSSEPAQLELGVIASPGQG